MRAFVTGIGGFAGVHLARQLLEAGHEVTGLVTGRPDRPRLRALAEAHPRFEPGTLAEGDVTDGAALERALTHARPDGVFHLAGIAFVPRAGADAARTFAVNTLGTVHLLDAVRRAVPRARVLVVGSSVAYGAVRPEELPVGEETPLRPVTVYGASKAAADLAAFQQWWAHDLAVVRVRAFNHTGPGQSPDFVCSDFARQIVAMEEGRQPPVLHVGNVEAVRDFSDVRDVVAGYITMWERGEPGAVYNLCSGVGTRVRTVIDLLAAESGRRIEVVPEPARVRGREVPAIVGSAARAAALGWSARIPLRQSLRDLLAEWRGASAGSPKLP